MCNRQLIFLASCLLGMTLSAGSDFTAVILSKDMQKSLQKAQAYVANQLAGSGATFEPTPAENMHITLKEIGDLGYDRKTKRAKFVPELYQVAKHQNPFKLYGAFRYAKLVIKKSGLVMLVLAPSPKHHLARAVQDGLKKSKHTGNLSVLKDRFDFPDKGHNHFFGHIHFGKKTANQLSKKIAQITSSFNEHV